MAQTNCLDFTPDHARALRFFQSRGGYSATPLLENSLPGGGKVLVKDETSRMGLGSFKALGGPYAVAKLLDRRGAPTGQTFVTASAGNHGISVAAGATAHGARARIYLARSVPDSFDARVVAHGADVVRVGETYEDSLAAANTDATQSGATLLADGSWPGYTEIPKLVMEGYTVIAEELRHGFESSGTWPSHVFLQAGVGGLAAAMAVMIRKNWAVQPQLIIVEPTAAPCLQASHKAGRPIRVEGPQSSMGRLDCKEPSIVAWHALERCNVSYRTLSEQEGEGAAETLCSMGIKSTPSGAAGLGGLIKFLGNDRQPENMRPLVIVTEGVAQTSKKEPT